MEIPLRAVSRARAAASLARAMQATRLQTAEWTGGASISKPERTRIQERWREIRSNCNARSKLADHHGSRNRRARAWQLGRPRMDLIHRGIRTIAPLPAL